MNRATLSAVTAILVASVTFPRPVSSQVSLLPVRGCLGRLVVDATTNATRWSRSDETATLRVVYNSLTAPTNFGIVGMTNGVVWGDSVLLDRSGMLDEIVLTLYNAITTYTALDSASMAVQIEDPASNVVLGSWTFRADFVPYGGLPNGYYVLLGISGLSAHPVSVGGWLVVKQRVLSSPGFPAAGLGVSSFTPPGVGASPPSLYSSQGGFFTIPDDPGDVGYRLVADVAAAATTTSWGRLKRLYH